MGRVPVSYSISPELKKRLDEAAKKQRRTQTAIIERGIELALDEKQD